MDAAILIAGIGIGLTLGSFAMHITRRLERKLIVSQRDALQAHEAAFSTVAGRLIALRKNCFITNELGHRVRYFKASPERRAKAEQD